MADILAAFDELENEERAKKKTASVNARRKGSQSSGRSGRPISRTSTNTKKARSDSPLGPPVISTGRLTPIPKHRPSAPSPSRSRESSVGGESRRISFAEPQRPSARRLYIPTKTANLASGFPYNKKLNKYGVLQSEWQDFSDEVVEAADPPSSALAWFLHRKDFIRRIKKELQYEGDFKRVLRKWNKHFKRRGFQAWLELPQAKGEPVRSQSVDPDDSSDEDKLQNKRDEKSNSKKFRIVVTSNVEKGSSVYSRSSSLTRAVTGEGANMQQKAAQIAHEKATEHAAEQDESKDAKDAENGYAEEQEGKTLEAATVEGNGKAPEIAKVEEIATEEKNETTKKNEKNED